jgi:WD40 repeat protein
MVCVMCLLLAACSSLLPLLIFLMLLPIAIALLVAVVAAYFFLQRGGAKEAVIAKRKATDPSPAAAPAPKPKHQKVDITAKGSAARKGSDATGSASPADASGSSSEHPLVHRHLRGHQGDVTGIAVSFDGRHVASISTDETLRLWTLVEGEKNTAFARHNLPKGQHGSAVAISADGKYVLIAISETKTIHIFGIKEEGARALLAPLHSFPTTHKTPITTLRMAANSSCIATLAEGSTDLNVHIFTVKGALIQSLPIAQLTNYSLALSDDSKFLAVGTKLSDTKVYELHYRKDAKGASSSSSVPVLEKVELATTLRGLQRGVRRLAFGSAQSGVIVSASLDGSFAEHSLLVRYAQKEDPKLRARTPTEFGTLEWIDVLPGEEDDAPLIALSSGSCVQFWSGTVAASSSSGGAASTAARLLASIPQAHKGTVTALAFNRPSSDWKGKHFLVTAGEGKTITVWNLPKL